MACTNQTLISIPHSSFFYGMCMTRCTCIISGTVQLRFEKKIRALLKVKCITYAACSLYRCGALLIRVRACVCEMSVLSQPMVLRRHQCKCTIWQFQFDFNFIKWLIITDRHLKNQSNLRPISYQICCTFKMSMEFFFYFFGVAGLPV